MAVLCAAGHCAFRATDERGLGWFSRSGRVGSVSERESVVLATLQTLLIMFAMPPPVQSSHQGASHSTYAARLC